MNRVYCGIRLAPAEKTVSDVEVFIIDAGGKRPLSPKPSLKLRNHSPDGFNWGYGGSGPAQLALAILLDWCADEETAMNHYQKFKFKFVAGWGDKWSITADEISEWIKAEHRKGVV